MALAPALGAGCGRERRPSAGGEPREKEAGLAEKQPPRALAAPPAYSIAPFPKRKGEDEEEEEKEREGGGVGELDVKIGWGMVEDFWSLQQRLFSSGGGSGSSGSSSRRSSLSYDCRMLIAAARVSRLLLETEPDSEVVQLWTGRDI